MIEHDGLDEAVHGALSTTMMLATTAAAVAIDGRRRALREAAERSEVEAQQLGARYAAELAAAKAEVAAAIAQGTPLDAEAAARSWQLVESWAHSDEELQAQRDQLADRIHHDLGYDPRELDAVDAAETAAVVAITVDADRAEALEGRDSEHRGDEHEEPDWDGGEARAERRDKALLAGVDAPLVEVVVDAEVANATPPTEAVRRAKAPKARKAPTKSGRAAEVQLQR